MTDSLLVRTAHRVDEYRAEAARSTRVGPSFDLEAARAAFGGPLPEAGEAPDAVIDRLVAATQPALVASTGPRYFGFVIGGALEAATARTSSPPAGTRTPITPSPHLRPRWSRRQSASG